ncbi:MAG: ATP-binding protein [Arcobacteraceae bacterium]|nr:ATP-binding protein [Arcobacteraceae bacterium]
MIPINQDDLIALNEAYHSPNSTIHFMFGRSKSGKTTFLRDFIVKKNYIYFSSFSSIETVLFPSFVDTINKKFKIHNSSTYYDKFEKILTLLDEQTIDEKIAVIFDNFEELQKVDKNSFELLLKFWEKSFSKKSIMLIVSSAIIPDDKSYKKIEKISTKTFFMENFSFLYIQNRGGLTPTDKMYIYSIFGASGYILSYYNTKNDFIKNVYHLSLNPSSPFFDYGFSYLKKDLGEIGTFSSILYAISLGNHKIGDIANALKLKSTYLSRYIEKLQEMMIIRKELPLSKEQIFSKYGRYHINDNFLKFWFRYIYPNIGNLELKKHLPVLKELDDTIVQNILTPAYTLFIKEMVTKNPEQFLGFTPNKIGSWWDNFGNNIDLIAYDNKQIVFMMIVWEGNEVATSCYNRLFEMAGHFKTTLKREYKIITKNQYLELVGK